VRRWIDPLSGAGVTTDNDGGGAAIAPPFSRVVLARGGRQSRAGAREISLSA
jgi:hypothetical protein